MFYQIASFQLLKTIPWVMNNIQLVFRPRVRVRVRVRVAYTVVRATS